MLKRIMFAAALVVGIGGAVQVHAASVPLSGVAAASAVQPVYWAVDPYGRRVWIARRPVYAPPPPVYRPYYRRHRHWDGYRWRY